MRNFPGILYLLGALSIARGVDQSSLSRAGQYSAAHQGKAFLVVQHGAKIFENYPNGGSPGERCKIYSGTKSFWIVAAIAADEEGIAPLGERASDTLREWRSDPRKARITLRELLQFTSGLEPIFHLHSDDYPDRNAVALNASCVAQAGERFIYGPAPLQAYGEVLRRKLAERHLTPIQYLERKVLAPMQLGTQAYKPDRKGNPLLASGFRQTAEEWSRMGALVLRRGAPVVAPGRMSECFHGTDANPAFGLGFWNNREAAQPGAREFDIEEMLELPWERQDWRNACICRDAPADLVASIGSGYQRLFIVPSMDLVVVRIGTGGHFSDREFLRLLFGPGA